MTVMLIFLAWCLLFVIAWPFAVLALLVLPIVWLLSIPFRLLGIVVEALLAFVRAVLFLPARLLGYRA
ncbi:MAG: hypothetical protein IT184_03820 [Acidobacteria bacterium]|nr:hypothetical protein [Acidobacteriota bacterium]